MCASGGCVAGLGFALFYAVALKLGKPTVLALANSLGTTTPAIYFPLMAVLLGTAFFGGAVVSFGLESAHQNDLLASASTPLPCIHSHIL